VINNYNYGEYVGHAIRSVLEQTRADVECIVVDDGSTDNSREVIRRFENVTAIFKENGRQTSAVRAGVARATGDVVILLDSDDRLFANACAEIAATWRPGISLIQYRLRKENPKGEVLGEYPDHEFLTEGHREHCVRWGEFPSSPTSGNAFARSTLQSALAHISDSEVEFPDGYLIYAAALFGEVCVMNKPLGAYLIHGRNISTSGSWAPERRKAQLLVFISQKDAIARLLGALHMRAVSGEALLGAYHWRTMAVLLYANPKERGLERFSLRQACLNGIRQFLVTPGIPLYRRVKNIFVLALLFVVPQWIVNRGVGQTAAR
jgi:glycosyltransferase involved in cell wall biosynthesis